MENEGKDLIEKESQEKQPNNKNLVEKDKKVFVKKYQKDRQTKRKKVNISTIFKTGWKLLSSILTMMIIFISLVIVIQRVTNNEQAFLGFRLFRVQTGSMIPKYKIGDVILVKQKNTDKIKVGEDVTYIGSSGVMKGKMVTHRVIQIEEIDGKKAFHTQGIANTAEDPIVYAEQINGIVLCRITPLTWLCNGLNNKYIFYFFGILPVTIYIFFSIAREKHDVKKDKILNERD